MDFYLPNECWESIFKFIIKDDEENNGNNSDSDRCCNNRRYLNSLSLVSKQFLSITNCLRFSVTISKQLKYCNIFKRFTNLTSLNLNGSRNNLTFNKILYKMSRLPLQQLTSLNISNLFTFPANGLRAFSQKITTLTSLTCSNIYYRTLDPSDLFLIAECFPLLKQLDLSHTSRRCGIYSGIYDDGVEALSLALIKLRKVNLSEFPINERSLFHLCNNCRYLEEVIMLCNWCNGISNEGFVSALRERPTLRSLSFSINQYRNMFSTSKFIDTLVSLKGLTTLVLHYSNISDEFLYSIAREGLPLTTLVLCCTGHSYDGIICLLSKCQHIQHLVLGSYFLKDQHVIQLSSFLGDLVSIKLTSTELTYASLLVLVRNCPSLSEIKMEYIGDKIVGNSDSLLELGVYPQLKSLYLGSNSWLSDEIITMFASIFPNLQLLDLNKCNDISEGICQVLRKCCKIKHLNLAGCWELKLHGMNFVVPNLEVLNLSYTKVDDETLYVISKNCRGLLQLLLEKCNGVTEKGVKHVLENCTLLRDHGYILHTVWR